MKLSQVIIEDYVQYKLPSLFLGTSQCFRNCPNCQNKELREKSLDIPNSKIIEGYMINPLTKAIVLGGLDPMDTFDEVRCFYAEFRSLSNDPLVIYTGYAEHEIEDKINVLKSLGGKIVIKFGHYIEGHIPHWDEVLGVRLASDNQYAKEFMSFR